jgi:hypothetical protein
LAILTGIATSSAASFITGLHARPTSHEVLAAQVHGFHSAFYVGVCFMIAASLIAAVVIKGQKVDPKAAAIAMH